MIRLKNKDINPDILEKIENCSQEDNVKNFIFELLDLEYDKRDESKPIMKKKYRKLIDQYK